MTRDKAWRRFLEAQAAVIDGISERIEARAAACVQPLLHFDRLGERSDSDCFAWVGMLRHASTLVYATAAATRGEETATAEASRLDAVTELESQIERLYSELRSLLAAGRESEFRERLPELRKLQRREAGRLTAFFEQRQPLKSHEVQAAREHAIAELAKYAHPSRSASSR